MDYENDDSIKRLLARSRYILAKKNQLTQNQKERAEILFNE
jgi:transposase